MNTWLGTQSNRAIEPYPFRSQSTFRISLGHRSTSAFSGKGEKGSGSLFLIVRTFPQLPFPPGMEMPITFYGTLGKGLDGLARTYLTRTLFPLLTDETATCGVDDYAEGKLIFHSPHSVTEKLRNALKNESKFFERLFVLVDRKSLIQEDGTVANKRILFNHLYAVLLDSNSLIEKANIWKSLREDASSANSSGEVAFRLSVKCTGKWRRKIDVTRLCEALGPKIADKTRWRIELRKPDLEISVRISDANVFIGFPLTKDPLSNRSYIAHMGLRGSVCDALVQLADLRDGDLVLDPMCGAGTILFEAAARPHNITAIGVDIDQRQLTLAAENWKHFQQARPKHSVPEGSNNCQYPPSSSLCIFPADCRHLPFPDHTFDRVISDIPFGKQHSNPEDLKMLYPSALREMLRVIKDGNESKMVLLTSYESYPLLQSAIDKVNVELAEKNADKPRMVKEAFKIDISLGETNGVIAVLAPTSSLCS